MSLRGSTINKLIQNRTKFERDVSAHPEVLLSTMLVIDPSSGSAGSMPGYAFYNSGRLIDSGIIEINHKQPIQYRLQQLYNFLADYQPTVLVIERIRGARAHEYLRWAVGVSICAVQAATVLEIPTTVWKIDARANDQYEKGDEQDALMMGAAVIRLAKEAQQGAVNDSATKKKAPCMLQRKSKSATTRRNKSARRTVGAP